MANILFVDDDPITLEILGKAAKILGHTPHLVSDAGQAIRIATQEKPDLIMMDMMMPEVDGLGILSILRSQPASMAIPVVILSAGASPDDPEQVKAAGAQEYISKPVSLNVLLDTIRRYTTSK